MFLEIYVKQYLVRAETVTFSTYSYSLLLLVSGCHLHYCTAYHQKHYSYITLTHADVSGGTAWRRNLVMQVSCWFARHGQEQHCNAQVISPWPCITVHGSCSRWFSGSNGCHNAMSSIPRHSQWLSTRQLIVIPAKVGGQHVAHSWNRWIHAESKNHLLKGSGSVSYASNDSLLH